MVLSSSVIFFNTAIFSHFQLAPSGFKYAKKIRTSVLIRSFFQDSRLVYICKKKMIKNKNYKKKTYYTALLLDAEAVDSMNSMHISLIS